MFNGKMSKKSKGVIKSYTPKGRQHNGQYKKTKRHKIIFKMVHRKHKMDQHCSTHRATLVINPVLRHEWGSEL